jgi:glycine/D-amino acid oxidase-like deaminating enzyme/nitrite reductase/ring-hydroxylating ferredoxin subunit
MGILLPSCIYSLIVKGGITMSTSKFKSFNSPPESYWIASTPQPRFPALEKDISVDVAIVGGGIAGITTAYMLTKRGVSVALLEADQILNKTTGNTTAKISSQHGLIYNKIKNKISQEIASQYADANETAIKTIQAIAIENSIECDYTTESAYVYTEQDDFVKEIVKEAETASSLGIKASYVEDLPLGFPIKAAVRFDDQAQFHPRKFLVPLADKIREFGGLIFENSRVVELDESHGLTLVTENQKRVKADKVVIASHYPCINKQGFYFTRLYPKRSYIVAAQAKEKYPGGMYITAEDPGRSIRNHMTSSGELILIGGERHKVGQSDDTTVHYNALAKFAESTFQVQDIPYRWSAQDYVTPDNLPYVGQFTSKTPNIYVATGFGKWGMTNGVASALILDDLIYKGKSQWSDAFDPSRKTFMASAKNFTAENINVAKELIGGKFSSANSNIVLERGEGRIVDIKEKKAGVYRDESGKLHIVDITCPHMGCELTWNTAEKSWDCPCHGSRFNYDGQILEGPAVKKLEFHKDMDLLENILNEKS